MGNFCRGQGGFEVLAAWLIIGVLLFSLFITVGLSRVPGWLKFVLALFVLVRASIGAILLENQGLQNDARAYHEEASALRASLIYGSDYAVSSTLEGKSGWTTTLGYLYLLGGPEPLIGLVFNSVVMALVSLLVFATARSLGASVGGSSFAAACLLAPQFFVWGTQLLREPVIWLAIAIVAYFGTELFSSNRGRKFSPTALVVGLMFGLLLLYWYRADIAVLLIGAILIYAIASSRLPGWARISAVGAGFVASPLIIDYITEQELLDADRIMLAQAELSSADSGYGSSSDVSVLSLYVNTPINFLRSLVGPFPWEIASLGPLAALEWVFWIMLAVPAAYVVVKKTRRVGLVTVLGLAMLLSMSLGSGNYGGLSRLRLMPLVALLPILSLWWDMRDVRSLHKGRSSRPLLSPAHRLKQ